MAVSPIRMLLVHGDRAVLQRAQEALSAAGEVQAGTAEEAARRMAEAPEGGVLVAAHALLGSAPLAGAGGPAWARVALAEEGELAACVEEVRAGRLAAFVRLPLQAPELLQAVHLARRQREEEAGGAAAGPAAEELERLRNDAVMIAAHDIRSPLSVMVGYAGVLLHPEQGLSERARSVAERIRGSGTRLLSMVDRILDLAALESGRQTLTCSETRLSELVQEAVDALAGMIEEKRIDVSVNVTGDEATYLLDQTRALQVLLNLLSNAVKFNTEGGSVEITCHGTPGEVFFTVRDSGVGLSAEQQAHVFERFARLSADRGQGSGLGLAIAKTMVELHGGTIRVESEPGRGAAFHFTLVPQKG